jgi:hypothetical protein
MQENSNPRNNGKAESIHVDENCWLCMYGRTKVLKSSGEENQLVSGLNLCNCSNCIGGICESLQLSFLIAALQKRQLRNRLSFANDDAMILTYVCWLREYLSIVCTYVISSPAVGFNNFDFFNLPLGPKILLPIQDLELLCTTNDPVMLYVIRSHMRFVNHVTMVLRGATNH